MTSKEPGSVPVAKQALAQKRNVRDLNTRLEMYVRAQAEKTRTVNQLKEALAKQEMEYRSKMKQCNAQYTDTIDKLRKEVENAEYNNKCLREEVATAISTKKEMEQRLIDSETRNASLSSEAQTRTQELNRVKSELDHVRTQYATLNYKYKSYEQERQLFDDKLSKAKMKNEQLLRELTKKESLLKTDKESYERLICDKNDEIERLREEIKELSATNSTTQTRLRNEFDNKLAEFVQKREEQYKQEKDEWMRIFKEEFNRKLRSFKEANQELSHSNVKQSEEITELRTRLSKLRQIKTELEVTNRNNEEEIEKIRNDLDDLRRTKDNEIKMKNAMILQERDRYKAKELQFDELAGIKLQLDAEIELYRNILNEAEASCGYQSPLVAVNDNNQSTIGRKRKRTKYNLNDLTPIGGPNATQLAKKRGTKQQTDGKKLGTDKENKVDGGGGGVLTPGLVRGAQNAQNDLKSFETDGSATDENEAKDEESNQETDDYTTPGNVEGATLHFSGLDLVKGMIEIKNMGETPLSLSGYILSNKNASAQFPLPTDIDLDNQETLRIYVGEQMYNDVFESMVSDEEDNDETNPPKAAKYIGDYKGAYAFWGSDVWTGNDNDCVRLYNPMNEEVARIEITPDMIPSNAKSKGCLVM